MTSTTLKNPPTHIVDPTKMTPREAEVYALYRAGLTTRQIAEKLGICQGSVGARLTIAKEKARSQ
ncbi:helix-turn-helix transcriptional regulator [Methylocystis echinoides]|uniref:RNA polymerase sigma factor 70 region 4 type 2 domain-containing protein n=1 Tax=Methylocystis echinoides TaxID=29468 RepID=A0A9W6LR84_9HYPH|nr:sigma factor-like helix-turn-helix DNA-binding protein [Methylocystis echinoides]GLI92360.1 hypothetical protein LMG27198_13520 [Methylocystis echinoides]